MGVKNAFEKKDNIVNTNVCGLVLNIFTKTGSLAA